MRPLVGMVGKSRAGKDTFAAQLVEKHGFVRYAFADNVRKVALAIDPIVDISEWYEELDPSNHGYTRLRLSFLVEREGWESVKRLHEVRRLLQAIGTDAIRALDPDFWVRLVMREIKSETRPVVITDCRFPNEAAAIERAGGKLIRVIRPDQLNDDQHVSETALDDWGTAYEVHNDTTIQQFRNRADWVAGLVKKEYEQ